MGVKSAQLPNPRELSGGTFAAFYREFIAQYVPSRRILSARQKETER